jgi:D-alanyl-D-alanine carboxypeptidase
MTHTIYDDPSGLSPKSVSSVNDLATLIRNVKENKEYLLDISRLQKYIGEKHTWHNVDKASAIDTFRGGKHGFTDEANRTLAALFDEELSSGNNRNVIIVLLGSDDLPRDIEILRTFLHTHVAYE